MTHSPRAFPWEKAPPVGACHVTRRRCRLTRGRQPRPRSCLRKGCGRKYQPRCRNQRYCQEPDCLRLIQRWQAARRQAKHRQSAAARAKHSQAERRAASEPSPLPKPVRTQKLRLRVVTEQNLFFTSLM